MTEGVSTPIASRTDFHDAIRSAIILAADTDAHEICIVDADFNDWPLNERAVVDALSRWATSRHKLVVFGKHFEEMPRRHTRFVEWRRQWSHIVQCRTDDDIAADALPTLLVVPGAMSVRLLDRLRYRGVASSLPGDLVEGKEAVDALLQRSIEAFPVTTLGL